VAVARQLSMFVIVIPRAYGENKAHCIARIFRKKRLKSAFMNYGQA